MSLQMFFNMQYTYLLTLLFLLLFIWGLYKNTELLNDLTEL